MSNELEYAETDIAIVGIAGRFPGADDVDALWHRIVAGDDCLTDVSIDAARAAGASEVDLTDPDYVRRSGMLADVAGFDHEFFGIGSRDADVMDPQHRHFLECAWQALEMSTNLPETFDGAIGVFGGCGMNTYLVNNLLTAPGLLDNMGWFLLRHTGNDKDFLVNNVAYRLDLHGPAINVQTACSTSLVAVHLAVQSLLSFECDLALAGGATIEVPHGVGYRYHEGEILSPDGHCRAFDAASGGTVLTSGVGVVAVRRLADAIDDGDPVLAVIKASAINNDGARKVGFLAPSVDGHADVVREALTVADLSADDLQLIEAHGTGTAVGDPIEVAALTEAFRASTDANGFCRLTSTKPNIGHLDTAAGAASLIKVVQALRHRTLPPMANHTAPSSLVDWDRSPFVVSDTPAEWPSDRPRRAGVSSLGVGGTNAHVLIQEAPALPAPASSIPEQTFALSALSQASLDGAATRLADHLERHPDVELADVAHTLITGRRAMSRRRVVTATSRDDAIALLRTPDRHRSFTADAPDEPTQLGFMFPGGGSQYRGMGAGLDERFTTFHELRRRGSSIVRDLGGPDLAPMFEPGPDDDRLRLPTMSLPSVFVTSVALARQWMEFGAQPDVLLGHSLGEYVAAHLSGVIELEDALSLVVTRSRLMEQVGGPDTAMLVVPLDEAQVISMLPETLSLATINAADECVVAGRALDVDAFADTLQAIDAAPIKVPLAAAAHSALLDPVLDEFRTAVRGVSLSAPQIPYPSNLSGTWITEAQATDPNYWVDHLRGTVRFLDGLRTVCADRPTALSELGPGHSLSSAARRTDGGPIGVAPALRHPDHDIDDTGFSLQAYARQWALGADIDLRPLTGADRRRVVLPTYAFERVHHWIEPGEARAVAASTAATSTADSTPKLTRLENLDEFTWLVEWVDAEPAIAAPTSFDRWIVHAASGDAVAGQLVTELTARGLTVQRVGHGSDTEPAEVSTCMITIAPPPEPGRASATDWFADAAGAARILGDAAVATHMIAVTRRAFAVDGVAANPADSMISGLVRVAGREFEALDGRVIDVGDHVDVSQLADELVTGGPELIGLRDGNRRRPVERQSPVAPADDVGPTIRDGGKYLITGAFGGVGFTIAEHLARDRGANLALLSRDPIPSGSDRARWVLTHGRDDATSRRLRRLTQLESYGTKIEVVVGDTTDAAALTGAVDEARRRLGDLDGAVHAAGVMHDRLLALATADDFERVIAPKVNGASALTEQLTRTGGELLVLVGSTSALVAPAGQAAYVGANTALDQMAGRHGSLRVVTIDFGLWAVEGMATDAARFARLGLDDWTSFEHPILDTIATAHDGSTVLAGRLDPLHHWVVDEHRTDDGTPVLPGTGHLELMCAAAKAAGVDDAALHDVVLLEPIVVPDGTTTAVRVTVSPAPDRRVTVELDDGSEWRVCSEARVEASNPTSQRVDTAMPLDIADPLERQRARLQVGPHWDAVTSARRGDEAAEVTIELDDASGDAAAWSIHPAITDLCTTAALALAPDRADEALWVPVRYERVAIRSPLPTSVRATATSRPATDDHLVADIDVRDLDGELVLEISGLELHPIGDSHFGTPEPATEHPAGGTGSLADLAFEHGLKAPEGVELFERIVASGFDRVVASSLRLDDVRQLADAAAGGGGAIAAPSATADTGAGASVESIVTQIWRELLGIDEIGLDEDFFDLGGHSLIAIRLMSRLNRDVGVRLELADLLGASTIGALTARLREVDPGVDARLSVGDDAATGSGAAAVSVGTEAAPVEARHLVTISPSGDGRPLYVVHGAGGNVLFLWSLARALSGKRPIFGFQAHGIDGVNLPDPSIEAMAERYVTELRAHAPGPYLLGGFSGGGLVTLEMARQLRELGDEVDLVVLFDSAPTGKMTPGTLERFRNIATHVRSGSARPALPYIKRGVKRRLRRFIPEKAERATEKAQQERALGYADTDTHGYVNLFYYFSAAADRYDVGRYPVDVLLVKADHVWPSQPNDYHWGAHVDGELTVVTTPGDHHSMFFPENAPRLAAVIAPILDRHDAT